MLVALVYNHCWELMNRNWECWHLVTAITPEDGMAIHDVADFKVLFAIA
jgi:hypothetical protein